MSELKQQVSYLRGLIEGAEFVEQREILLWDGLLSFCDSIANELDEVKNSYGEVVEYLEAIDEDLGVIEEYFDDGQELEVDKPKEVYCCEKVLKEVTCPHCDEEICFEDEAEDYEIVCPECNKIAWSSLAKEVPGDATVKETSENMEQ